MDLAAPPVVLPDFHHKHNIEMPSSIAIATRETIRPTLTSAAVNCGMALMAFDSDQPSERAVSEFFDIVRRRLPYRPATSGDLTVARGRALRIDGARFAADRYRHESSRPRSHRRGRPAGSRGIRRRQTSATAASVAAHPAVALPLRHRRPQQSFHRAAARRGDLRARHGATAGDRRGSAHPAVPRRRRDPDAARSDASSAGGSTIRASTGW